jgi:hypothetical protein
LPYGPGGPEVSGRRLALKPLAAVGYFARVRVYVALLKGLKETRMEHGTNTDFTSEFTEPCFIRVPSLVSDDVILPAVTGNTNSTAHLVLTDHAKSDRITIHRFVVRLLAFSS